MATAHTKAPKRTTKMAARPLREFAQQTYGARVAARIRELRVARGWTVQQLADQLRREGADIPVPTLYAYERGKLERGADLPMNLVPLFARVFAFKTAHGWLPSE